MLSTVLGAVPKYRVTARTGARNKARWFKMGEEEVRQEANKGIVPLPVMERQW